MGLSSVATIAMFGTGYHQLAQSGARQGPAPTPVLTAPGTVQVSAHPSDLPGETGAAPSATVTSGYVAPVLLSVSAVRAAPAVPAVRVASSPRPVPSSPPGLLPGVPPVVQLVADTVPLSVPVLAPAIASAPVEAPAVRAHRSAPDEQPRAHHHARHPAHRAPVENPQPALQPAAAAPVSHGKGHGRPAAH